MKKCLTSFLLLFWGKNDEISPGGEKTFSSQASHETCTEQFIFKTISFYEECIFKTNHL
jgi:hypothetical protein